MIVKLVTSKSELNKLTAPGAPDILYVEVALEPPA